MNKKSITPSAAPEPEPGTNNNNTATVTREDLLAFQHDANNLIQIALWDADSIERDPKASPAAKEAAKRIAKAVMAVSRMASDLAERATGAPERREPVDLATIVSEAATSPLATRHGHRVTTLIENGLPPVAGDAGELRQLVENLAGNAVKYSPAGSEIILSAHAVRDTVQLCVRDLGDGIAEEYRVRIFEDGFRLPGHESGVEGTGRGLAICRRVAEAHGGSIRVVANAPKGSIFIVTLSVAGAPA